MDKSELRAVLAEEIRAHTLLNGRCEACGERATHQSLHQADVLIDTWQLRVELGGPSDDTYDRNQRRLVGRWLT